MWRPSLQTTEIVRLAHEKLEHVVWEFITGGGEPETSILRNREAIESLAFRARVLRNVEKIDTTATLLGTALRISTSQTGSTFTEKWYYNCRDGSTIGKEYCAFNNRKW